MSAPTDGPADAQPRIASVRFLLAHPAHLIAMGFGAGLSPKAPGTVGTAWAWLAYLVFMPWMSEARWAWLLGAALVLGWWACSVTARNLDRVDPGQIVWDEILAFWLVLWLIMPASLPEQLAAFGLFRFFDAVKPGPVGWADRLFHDPSFARSMPKWQRAGLGILIDDLVAAACTLLVLAGWRTLPV
ncbi:MAG: phosphatidylglycerophosphatase A [Hylemonella sp.]